MDSSNSNRRRSPRLAELARLLERTESEKQRESQLRRAQYEASDKQARNERRRISYHAKKNAQVHPHDHEASASGQVPNSAGEDRAESSQSLTNIDQVQCQTDQDAEASRKRKGKFIAPAQKRHRANSYIPGRDKSAVQDPHKQPNSSLSLTVNEQFSAPRQVSKPRHGEGSQATQEPSRRSPRFIPQPQCRYQVHIQPRSTTRKRSLTEEQLSIERERDRLQQRFRRQNLTKDQKLIVREHDRIRKKTDKEKQNLPTTSTGYNHHQEDLMNHVEERGKRARLGSNHHKEAGAKNAYEVPATIPVSLIFARLINSLPDTLIPASSTTKLDRANEHVSSLRQESLTHHSECGQASQAHKCPRFSMQNQHRKQVPTQIHFVRSQSRASKEKQNLPSRSIVRNSSNQFEYVMNQHIQQEVERIMGHTSNMAMDIRNGYMELGPDHRAPLRMRYEDMFEFDEQQVDRPEDDVDETPPHEDMQEGPSKRGNNRKKRTLLPNRGFHNCARGSVDIESLSRMQITDTRSCDHCGAKLFPQETNQFCCLNGKVKLPDLPVPPELMHLYTVQSEQGAHFRKHIRSYNHVFAFTSIGVHIDQELANSNKGVYTYRAQGTMYHKIGSLITESSNRPRYLQMYIYDTDHELENRLKEQQFAAKENKGKEPEQEPQQTEEPLNREVLAILKKILDRDNPYVRVVRQIGQGNDLHDVRLHIKEQPTYRRNYNMPTSPQVAAVLVGGEDPTEVLPRDIIIQTESGQLLNVPDTACFYDPLQYPLLHPYGSFGWDLIIFTENERRISVQAYYAYMLQVALIYLM